MSYIVRSVTVTQDVAETTLPLGNERTFLPGLISARATVEISGEFETQTAIGYTLDEVLAKLRAFVQVPA